MKRALALLAFLAAPAWAASPPYHVTDPAAAANFQDLADKTATHLHDGKGSVKLFDFSIDAKLCCGARGDGTTDDTAALQAAFDLCDGKRLYIPEGQFLITSTLTVRHDDCIIEGAGEVSTKLIMNSGTSGGIAYGTNDPTTPRRGIIRYLGITGPGSTGDGLIVRGNDLVLDHFRIVNWFRGAFLDDSVIGIVNTKFQDVRIESNRADGIKGGAIGGQGVTATYIIDSRFSGNGTTRDHFQINLIVAAGSIINTSIEPNGIMRGVNFGPSSSGISVLGTYNENSDYLFGNQALDDVRGLAFFGNYIAGVPVGSSIAVNFDSVRGLMSGGNDFSISTHTAYKLGSVSDIQMGPDRMRSVGKGIEGAPVFASVIHSTNTFSIYNLPLYVKKTSGNRVVTQSPDGACWDSSVSNLGIAVITSVTCPTP